MKSRIAARNLMENPEAVHAATGDERPTMAVSGSIPAWHGFFPPFSRSVFPVSPSPNFPHPDGNTFSCPVGNGP